MHRRAGVAYKHLLTCEWCGQPFYAHRKDARFDSGKCRTAYCRFMKHARTPLWVSEGYDRFQFRLKINGVEI